jgi:alpha-glucosidase
MEYIEAVQYEASQYIFSLPQGINMSIRKLFTSAAAFSGTVLSQSAAGVEDLDGPGRDLYDKDLSVCSGYIATTHHETRSGFYADLSLAGEACNVYGTDLPDLKLEVEYQTSERLHVKIKDSNNTVYQVGNHIFAKSSYAHFHSGSRQRLPTSRVRSMVLAQRLEASIRFPG